MFGIHKKKKKCIRILNKSMYKIYVYRRLWVLSLEVFRFGNGNGNLSLELGARSGRRRRRQCTANDVLAGACACSGGGGGSGGRCRCREVTVRCEQRCVMLYRLEVTVPVGDLQLGRQLLLPLGPPVLEPRLYLHLGQVQRFGQLHALAHAQIFVRLQHPKTVAIRPWSPLREGLV